MSPAIREKLQKCTKNFQYLCDKYDQDTYVTTAVNSAKNGIYISNNPHLAYIEVGGNVTPINDKMKNSDILRNAYYLIR